MSASFHKSTTCVAKAGGDPQEAENAFFMSEGNKVAASSMGFVPTLSLCLLLTWFGEWDERVWTRTTSTTATASQINFAMGFTV